MFSRSCCEWCGARCHLGEIDNEVRRILLFQSWVLFSVWHSFLGQEGWRRLGRVVRVLTRDVLLRWGGGRVFLQFQCSLTSWCFVPSIFLRSHKRFPLVLRVCEKIGVVGRGRFSWPSGRSWRRCCLGYQWISVGPWSWQFDWGVRYPR